MSEASSSSRECNRCNRRVNVIIFGNMARGFEVFCCLCNNILVPDAYSPWRSLEANYIELMTASLQNIARGDDDGGRRGAPPAAKSAIEALETFEVVCSSSIEVCAVCKDSMVIGEIWKKLPCGHCYHGDCILPWLQKRNSCPLCRFQL